MAGVCGQRLVPEQWRESSRDNSCEMILRKQSARSVHHHPQQFFRLDKHLPRASSNKASRRRVLKLDVQNPELWCTEGICRKNKGGASAIEVAWVT